MHAFLRRWIISYISLCTRLVQTSTVGTPYSVAMILPFLHADFYCSFCPAVINWPTANCFFLCSLLYLRYVFFLVCGSLQALAVHAMTTFTYSFRQTGRLYCHEAFISMFGLTTSDVTMYDGLASSLLLETALMNRCTASLLLLLLLLTTTSRCWSTSAAAAGRHVSCSNISASWMITWNQIARTFTSSAPVWHNREWKNYATNFFAGESSTNIHHCLNFVFTFTLCAKFSDVNKTLLLRPRSRPFYQDQDQHLHNFQDQDQGKTFYFETKTKPFLLFLYRNLGSLIQCQRQLYQDQQVLYDLFITL